VEEVPLISVEEFNTNAPDDLKVDPETERHRFNLNRLTFEMQQRKRLISQVEEMNAKKVTLQSSNTQQKQFMAGLGDQVSQVHKGALDLYRKFPHPDQPCMPEPASDALPAPLYTLYHAATIYKQTQHEAADLNITIDGDVSAAREALARLADDNNNNNNSDPVLHIAKRAKLAASHDSDVKSTSTSATATTTSTASALINNAIASTAVPFAVLSKSFPLTVTLELSIDGNRTKLRFSYLPKLRVVTLLLLAGSRKSIRLPTQSLMHLYRDDTGKALGKDPSGQGTLDYNKIGVPFRWVQSLCGIFYPHPGGRDEQEQTPTIPDVLDRIRRRFTSRHIISEQLAALSRLSFEPLRKTGCNTLHYKTKTKLESWNAADAKQYFACSNATAKSQSQSLWWHDGASYYTARLSCGNVSLSAVFQVPTEYPIRPSVCRVQSLTQVSCFAANSLVSRTAQAEELTAATDSSHVFDNNAHQIQNHVNHLVTMHNDHTLGDYLLINQVWQLMISLDIHMQALAVTAGEFDANTIQPHQGKLFQRAYRGRDRRVALHYNEQQQLFEHN
jgi:Fms-interacting protein/Thoc5